MSFEHHPNHITSLAMHNLVDSQVEVSKGVWQPARPLGAPTIAERFKYAWWVFIGKADVLTWVNQD